MAFQRFSKKLIRYSNATIISISFVQSFAVWPVIFCLNLNKALLILASGKLIILSTAFKAGSSLCYYVKLLDVFE